MQPGWDPNVKTATLDEARKAEHPVLVRQDPDRALWEDATTGSSVLWMAPRSGGRASYIVVALGSNVHIFARPHRREELAQCFETVLGSPIRTVAFPGIDQPMLVVSFSGGGHLSIEFRDDAPDDEQPRLGAWLELRADDPAGVLQAALGAGLTEVKHPGHPYYFMIPGGQVFTIAPTS
jgi:hypothetical protein